MTKTKRARKKAEKRRAAAWCRVGQLAILGRTDEATALATTLDAFQGSSNVRGIGCKQ